MKVGVSVGHRLRLLVACQTAIAITLVVAGVRTISRMATDYRHMYEVQIQSIYALRKAIEEAAGLVDGTRSAPLEDFYRRYRTNWEVASGSTVDSIRFRSDLSRAGESMLP